MISRTLCRVSISSAFTLKASKSEEVKRGLDRTEEELKDIRARIAEKMKKAEQYRKEESFFRKEEKAALRKIAKDLMELSNK